MSWFEEQIETRRRMDEKELEDSFARLAASVMSDAAAPRFSPDNAVAADSAMETLLAYYGVRPSAVPDDVAGPLERIEYATRSTGVMKRPVRLTGAWWKDATGAYLGMLEDGTPVALMPRSLRGYGYVDPTTHKMVRVTSGTAGGIREEAICFYRSLPQRELGVADVLRFMGRSLDWGDYIAMVVATLVSTAIGLLPAIASKLLFSRIIPSGMPSLILPIAALLFGMTLSQALIQVTSSVILSRLQTKLQVQMEAATYARTLLLPPSFFKDYAPGDLTSRLMSMTQLVTIFSQTVIEAGLTSFFSLAYVFQTVAFAPQLVVPALLVVLAEVAATALVTLLTMRYNRRQTEASAKLSGITPSLLRGIQKIKLAGAERRAFSHWARGYATVADASYKRPALLISAPALVPLIGSAGTVLIYWLAAATKVSVADYMAFNTAFGSVSGAIVALSGTATVVSTIRPLLELVGPIMRTVPEVISTKRQVSHINGSIEMSNVSFRYADNLPLVLDNVSLNIRPGEFVAIVGRTGCGKSTLMRLLLGFEQPVKGAVYYSGQDISGVDIRSLRRHVGVVMQNGSLFAGDILMNIIVATPKATIADAWEAAELAGVADDIQRMPMGMQTLLSEGGGGVSGGQRQRLLIARAVCGKPKVLMLDEATSALDNVTQKHVSDALAGLSCTRIVIAHRLSTIRYADRIIMLDQGKIVESGTYDELVALGGAFANLVARQQIEGE